MIGRAGGFHFDLQRRWLVLFFDPVHRLRRWDHFNTPGFRHCCLLAYQPIPAMWVYLDYGADGTVLATIEVEEAWRLIAKICRSDGTILEWETPKKKPKQPLLYPPNCVAFCQQFLGIRRHLWTPYGLALCLADLGAKPMFGTELPRRGLYGRSLWRRLCKRTDGDTRSAGGSGAGQEPAADDADS